MRERRHSADSLFSVLLLFLFLTVGAAALALGVRVWRAAEERMERQFAAQTPVQYVAGKARQADRAYIAAFADGTEALCLPTDWEGETYVTWLYCHEGGLYELFTPENVRLTPGDGTRLLDTERLTLTEDQETGLIRAALQTADGQTGEALIAPRREKEADA